MKVPVYLINAARRFSTSAGEDLESAMRETGKIQRSALLPFSCELTFIGMFWMLGHIVLESRNY